MVTQTSTAFIHLSGLIYKDMDESALTGALFLDLRKAFNTVDHAVLLSKLQMLNPDATMLKWLSSYLYNRTQCVNFKGIRSSCVQISNEVPQGSILGPLLFIFYVNDLLSEVPNADIIIFIDNTTTLSHSIQFHPVTNDMQENLMWSTDLSNSLIKLRLS